MRKIFVRTLAAVVCLAACLEAAPVTKRPKLLLTIVLDQFRYDFLVRHRDQFKGGFVRLLEHGAVFSNANYDHFPTVTAVGHSTIMSGSIPAISGIVENEWYDGELQRDRTSVEDAGTRLLGAGTTTRHGSSPKLLMTSTVGDELRMAHPQAKVIGLSLKDRSAILTVGHTATASYWFDSKTGNFVSSSYYFPEGKSIPAYVEQFNAKRVPDRWIGKPWLPIDGDHGGKPLLTLPSAAGETYYEALTYSTFGNDVLEEFTERVIDVEELGADGFTDILTVSFSSNDLVGHRYGPDSPQVRDVTLRTDLLLDKLLKFVDKEVGLSETAIVLTSDHGICPMPEAILPLRMDAGRIPKEQVIERVNTALAKRFGVQGKWVDGKGVRSLYLNQALIREAKITEAQAEAAAAETLRSMKHIYRVYTKSDLARNRVGNDPIDQRVRNGFYAPRAANLFVIADPYYTFGSNGIDHGSPFTYDTNVPVIFLGRWFKAGLYTTPIRVNDIAPTLSAILELPAPSGNVGRPLTEIFVSMN